MAKVFIEKALIKQTDGTWRHPIYQSRFLNPPHLIGFFDPDKYTVAVASFSAPLLLNIMKALGRFLDDNDKLNKAWHLIRWIYPSS